ncbi:MAG: hypothetical protein Kow0045_02110 [Albidovulum sp.]
MSVMGLSREAMPGCGGWVIRPFGTVLQCRERGAAGGLRHSARDGPPAAPSPRRTGAPHHIETMKRRARAASGAAKQEADKGS